MQKQMAKFDNDGVVVVSLSQETCILLKISETGNSVLVVLLLLLLLLRLRAFLSFFLSFFFSFFLSSFCFVSFSKQTSQGGWGGLKSSIPYSDYYM